VKIRKNDTVMVVTGKDKGKKGKVRYVFTDKNRILVEHINMIKRHARASKQARQAGIIEREAPINTSNVKLLCSKCNKPARTGKRFLEDGSKVRFCKSCDEVMD
jgi:large subunit ribosomal protein L24